MLNRRKNSVASVMADFEQKVAALEAIHLTQADAAADLRAKADAAEAESTRAFAVASKLGDLIGK